MLIRPRSFDFLFGNHSTLYWQNYSLYIVIDIYNATLIEYNINKYYNKTERLRREYSLNA